MNYLKNKEMIPLTLSNFKYPRMCRRGEPTDGSCYFHSIADAYFTPYHQRMLNGEPISRKRLIKRMRRDLAKRLDSEYSQLSRGTLKDFGKFVPRYSLDAMKEELASKNAVDNVYQEFISNQLNKDIYILDAESEDVIVTGSDDDDIYYKNRESIVLFYLPGHYELVGILHDEGDQTTMRTLFRPDDPFIEAIRDRRDHLRSVRIKTS